MLLTCARVNVAEGVSRAQGDFNGEARRPRRRTIRDDNDSGTNAHTHARSRALVCEAQRMQGGGRASVVDTSRRCARARRTRAREGGCAPRRCTDECTCVRINTMLLHLSTHMRLTDLLVARRCALGVDVLRASPRLRRPQRPATNDELRTKITSLAHTAARTTLDRSTRGCTRERIDSTRILVRRSTRRLCACSEATTDEERTTNTRQICIIEVSREDV
jgi:hypothetical protein